MQSVFKVIVLADMAFTSLTVVQNIKAISKRAYFTGRAFFTFLMEIDIQEIGKIKIDMDTGSLSSNQGISILDIL